MAARANPPSGASRPAAHRGRDAFSRARRAIFCIQPSFFVSGSISASVPLQSAGFEVVHSTYAFAVLVLPILLLRTVPSRLGLHSGFDAERQVKEHSSRGILQRSVEAMLAQERRHLARGGTLAMGASCLAIGRVPP